MVEYSKNSFQSVLSLENVEKKYWRSFYIENLKFYILFLNY